MVEDPRAQELSGAIDRLLRTGRPGPGARGRELQELLALAWQRRRASRLFSTLGEAYRSRVWQRLSQRLLPSQPAVDGPSASGLGGEARPADGERGDTPHAPLSGERTHPASGNDLDELFEVVKLGYAASRRLAKGSMPYRELVWLRLQRKLRAVRAPGEEAAVPSAERGSAWAAVPRLLRLPSRRGEVSPERLQRRPLIGSLARLSGGALAAATLVAALVVTLMAVSAGGPVLAEVAHIFQVVGRRAGILEVEEAPSLNLQALVSVPLTKVKPIPMSPQEAAARMWLPIELPYYIPTGYQQVQAAYYPPPAALKQQTSGIYVLVYREGEASVRGKGNSAHTFVIQYEADDKALILPRRDVTYLSVAGMEECAYIKGSALLAAGESLRCLKGGVVLTVSYLGDEESELEEMVRIAASVGEAQGEPALPRGEGPQRRRQFRRRDRPAEDGRA